ncbi:hypothetical protein D3H66_26680, partial [Citrobacter portucalensis]
FTYQRVGDLSTEMIDVFFRSLSYTMGVTLLLQTKGSICAPPRGKPVYSLWPSAASGDSCSRRHAARCDRR